MPATNTRHIVNGMPPGRTSDANGTPITVVLINMPRLLRQIVQDLLDGQSDIRVESEEPACDLLDVTQSHANARLILIEADAHEFAQACERLPDVRIVAVARNGRRAFARFRLGSREQLSNIVRCVALEEESR